MKTDLVGIGGLLAALLLSFGLSVAGAGEGSGAAAGENATRLARPIEDARGQGVFPRPYGRVVSMNPLADHLLIQMLESERLVAVHELSADGHPDSWRFGAYQVTTSEDSVESLLELRPDLVVASPFIDEAVLARLREAGVSTVDPGPMRGVETTLATIEMLGEVLGVTHRADVLASRYQRELRALAGAAAERGRTPGMYLAIYGDAFFGGTSGTSYGDVLEYGGIRDVAEAAGHTGWPRYSAETLVALDPELIVTQEGMAQTLREHAVTARLRAALDPGGIIELPAALNSDAGLGVVRGAHLLGQALERRAVAPEQNQTSAAPNEQIDR